ncbi:MAG: hypothetical protein CMF55_01200 [Legionellales bacterium]|nr:hypothetical protein [Legionellales bacterium]HAG61988.1 hypothetical protein [Coxiellaceae bacterium]
MTNTNVAFKGLPNSDNEAQQPELTRDDLKLEEPIIEPHTLFGPSFEAAHAGLLFGAPAAIAGVNNQFLMPAFNVLVPAITWAVNGFFNYKRMSESPRRPLNIWTQEFFPGLFVALPPFLSFYLNNPFWEKNNGPSDTLGWVSTILMVNIMLKNVAIYGQVMPPFFESVYNWLSKYVPLEDAEAKPSETLQKLLKLKQNLNAVKFALETNNSSVAHQGIDSTTEIADLTPNLLDFFKSSDQLSNNLWLSNDFTKPEPSDFQKFIAGAAWLSTLLLITSLCIVEATEAQIFGEIPQLGVIISNIMSVLIFAPTFTMGTFVSGDVRDTLKTLLMKQPPTQFAAQDDKFAQWTSHDIIASTATVMTLLSWGGIYAMLLDAKNSNTTAPEMVDLTTILANFLPALGSADVFIICLGCILINSFGAFFQFGAEMQANKFKAIFGPTYQDVDPNNNSHMIQVINILVEDLSKKINEIKYSDGKLETFHNPVYHLDNWLVRTGVGVFNPAGKENPEIEKSALEETLLGDGRAPGMNC